MVNNPVEAKITSPLNLQCFNKPVGITGIIKGQFNEWRLYYSPESDPLNETLLQSGVTNELNYTWDAANIPARNYYIKLKVFNQSSLSAVDTVEIAIDHHIEWAARYNGSAYEDVAYAIALDAQGNVYVTGFSYGDNYDYCTIKYDTNGNQLWAARYDGPVDDDWDVAYAIAVDAQGNVYVTGESWVSKAVGSAYCTIKYDTNGNQLWVARYNGSDFWEIARAIALDAQGNVYVTGWSTGISGRSNYATVKYDTNGNQLWTARYYGPAPKLDEANAIAVDASGNVYVTGRSANGTYTDYYDYATIKYDTNGNQLWTARYDKSPFEENAAYAIALDAQGNVYVTGKSYTTAYQWTGYDYVTIKYDTNGNPLWTANYNEGGDNEEARAIALDAKRNVYVTGWSYSYENSPSGYGDDPGGPDCATVKYNTNGNQLWSARYKGAIKYGNTGEAIAVDAQGNAYVAGGSYGSGTYSDYSTIKYSQLKYDVTKVAASSVEGEYGPDKVIDGNFFSRWSGLFSDPQWISLDLGSRVTFNKVILRWEAAFAKSYQIQVSDDNLNWQDVYSTTTGDGGVDEITFDTVTARYIRMYGTQRATEWGYSLYEFEVYSPQASNISGKVSIQGRTNNSELIAFELRQPGQTTPINTYSITTASDGSYSLANIPAGTYDLTAKSSNTLKAKNSSISVIDGQTTANIDFNLLGGDATNDNYVDYKDRTILIKAFGTIPGDPAWDERADFNKDGTVDYKDRNILRKNFGLLGAL